MQAKAIRDGMWIPSIVVCGLILLVSSSRCPESKKPHHTSCTIFYSCVNLPGGGYVWVPSRCTDGLVFQPYLRLCVVPGDIWTCDTLSIETPESISLITDDTSSYLGYTQNPAEFSETIDSSYVVDDVTDLTTEAVTPYPLIEFDETAATTSGDEDVKNASCHKESNVYIDNRRPMPLPLMQKYEDIVNEQYKLLNELMSRLHIHKKLSAAISDSLSIENHPVAGTTTVKPTVAIFATHNRNISLNYLVQSYVDDKSIETEKNRLPTNESTTASTQALSIDNLDPDKNIIVIDDNFGNKRYLTINEYKTVVYRLTPRQSSVIACSKNIRLPNRTDCDRYYICDPRTATVLEYSCPPHTAFNAYSRICDTKSAKTCRSGESPPIETFVERVTKYGEGSHDEKLCQELGKIKDPASDFHYYICYSMPESEEIKSIRMTCPNALIFCQSKRVCTTKRLCSTS